MRGEGAASISAFIYGRLRAMRDARNTIVPHNAHNAIAPDAGVARRFPWVRIWDGHVGCRRHGVLRWDEPNEEDSA